MHASKQPEVYKMLSLRDFVAAKRAIEIAIIRVPIESIVHIRLGVSFERVHGSVRGSPVVVFARQLALYLLQTVGGLSAAEAAMAYARDRTTAVNAMRRIELRREEDPAIDLAVALIEADARRGLANAKARQHLGL